MILTKAEQGIAHSLEFTLRTPFTTRKITIWWISFKNLTRFTSEAPKLSLSGPCSTTVHSLNVAFFVKEILLTYLNTRSLNALVPLYSDKNLWHILFCTTSLLAWALTLPRTTLTFLGKIDCGEKASLSSCKMWAFRNVISLNSYLFLCPIFIFNSVAIQKQLDEVLYILRT